ncbi:MAG: phosphatidylserine/phosphatidylglycerophosphate/cardiolipin synthase family protein [Thermoanaerobaculia bacterium]
MRRKKGPRRPRNYRIPIETYLVALAVAFALSVALSLLSRPEEVRYVLPHAFGVRDDAFLPSAHALANPIPLAGNRLEILENGIEIFPAMLSAIAAAQRTINLETYIFWSGEVATRFREALSERARAGVQVRVLLDGVGSSSKLDEDDVRAMREAGCTVELYHPLRPWMLDAINNRTHRRILVVDGKIGFTGGAGIADVWLGNADAPDHWRETHVRVEGPVVAELQAAFQENWAEVRGELLLGADHFPRLERVGSARSQVIDSSARSTSSATKLLYAVSIAAASERLSISNSYFLPDGETIALLVDAARRGVDVRIIVPGKINDVPATKAAGRARFGELLRGGVKIFEYEPAMFHPKSMVVDGIFSTIGSTNFDNRSFRLNDELNLTVYDAEFADALEASFNRDLARSRPYTYEKWLERGFFERAFEWAVVPFRSQL